MGTEQNTPLSRAVNLRQECLACINCDTWMSRESSFEKVQTNPQRIECMYVCPKCKLAVTLMILRQMPEEVKVCIHCGAHYGRLHAEGCPTLKVPLGSAEADSFYKVVVEG